MDTVFNSIVFSQLAKLGYSFQPVPSNSVAMLLPLENEKEREHAIHVLRNLCGSHSADGPLAVSFGAHSLYDESNGEIIIQLVHWDICTVEHPPLQFTLKDCNTEKAAGSIQRCCCSTRRGHIVSG